MKSHMMMLSFALFASITAFAADGVNEMLQFQVSVQPEGKEAKDYQLNTTMGSAAVFESSKRVPYLQSCVAQPDGTISMTMEDVSVGMASKITPIRLDGDALVAEVDISYVELLQMNEVPGQVGGGCMLGEPKLKTMRASGPVALKRGEAVQLFKGDRDPKQGGITVKVL